MEAQKKSVLPAQTASPAANPLQMLQYALENGFDLDRVDRLMELERQWKGDKAREAFNIALAEFKKTPVRVVKDRKNKQYNNDYASIGAQVNTVSLALAPHGLSTDWEIEQTDNRITVTCVLTHTLGHSKRVTLSGPPDTSGSKNALQQIKSTLTYLEIATHQAVTGIVAIDAANADDDGNGAGLATLSAEQIEQLESLIKEVGANKTQFLKWAKVDSLDQILAKNHKFAVETLERKRKAS